MPRSRPGTRSAARARASCSTAPPTFTRSMREEFFSLCIREAGKTLLDAVLEVREAVDFLRYYASRGAAPVQPGRCRCPGPTGEQNELRLHGRGVFACISPVEFPAGDLHRPGRGAAGRRQCRHRQAGRADAADRRARGRADAPGGHPEGRRPAGARRRQGRRRTLTAHPLHRRRRLHRLDRDRAHDQPHAGRARRADHPVHRRDRRPECDDRRLLGAARAGDARRRRLSLPERRPALLGACACCSSRTMSPTRCWR